MQTCLSTPSQIRLEFRFCLSPSKIGLFSNFFWVRAESSPTPQNELIQIQIQNQTQPLSRAPKLRRLTQYWAHQQVSCSELYQALPGGRRCSLFQCWCILPASALSYGPLHDFPSAGAANASVASQSTLIDSYRILHGLTDAGTLPCFPQCGCLH